MKLKILFIILVIGQQLSAQRQLTLTKQQMYADMDTLIATISKTSPQIQVKKELWHYNFLVTAHSLRNRIDTTSSDLSFYVLLINVLNAAQDLHTSTWGEQSEWAKQQENAYLTVRNGKFKLAIPHTFSKGKYFVTFPFILGTDTISIGSEITKINGQKIDEYLRHNFGLRSGYSYNLSSNTFSCVGFYKNVETIFKDSLNLSFLTPKNTALNYDIKVSEPTKYLPEINFSDTTRVEYWADSNILYIRLTEMNEKYKHYLKAKLSEFKDSLTQNSKVIIDIRNNGGGNDNVWIDLYADLIDKPIYYSLKLAVPNYISQQNEFYQKRKKTTEKLLKTYNFYTVADTKESIEPSNTSIRFKGKIYIVAENVYSSAGSAVSVANANQNDNLISVGRPTGQFLGIGLPPKLYQLPNTKLKYRVAPSMEITNIKRLSDLMQDKVQIEVPFDINYFEEKFESKISITSKEFLMKYDPFIKTVLRQ